MAGHIVIVSQAAWRKALHTIKKNRHYHPVIVPAISCSTYSFQLPKTIFNKK